ncbi:hypothetical protein [Ottowia sp.]
MAETKSTCPYCGVGCGLAYGGPRSGACERRSRPPAHHG